MEGGRWRDDGISWEWVVVVVVVLPVRLGVRKE